MYKPGTILELKEQRPASTRKNRENEVIKDEKNKPIKFEFPYNKVKVIGESPISYGDQGWEGVGARGVIIQPLSEFAGNLDEPFGKLRTLYNVVEIPEEVVIRPEVKVVQPGDLGPTPEDIFAAEAPGKAPEPGQKRARTAPESPLGDVKDPAASSPLGDAAPPAKPEPTVKNSPL
jgi:hypothetical protein